MILRSKTVNLLQTRSLTKQQEENSKLNIKEMNEGATILHSYPQRLVLELTNVCNLNCIMCGRDDVKFAPTFLPLDHVKKFEPILNDIEEVTLFGWGEPTVHPDFRQILAYLDQFPVRKYFVTNGMRLGDLTEELFRYHVDIMAISLDGARAETNDRIRRGGKLDQVIANLRTIVAEKKKRNLEYPYMNFVFAAMKSNIEELPDLVDLAADIGLDEVKSVYLTVFTEKLRQESLFCEQDLVKKVFNKAVERAEKRGIKIKLPYLQGEDVGGTSLHKPCYVGWRDFFLGSDGFVRSCQSTPLELFKIDKYSTFDEMWNSQELQAFRAQVNCDDQMPEPCQRCYQSSHANWNQEHAFLQIEQCFAPKWD